MKTELMTETKYPVASVSLDLDDLWSYLRIHGDPGWEKFPSYLETFIPQVLDILDTIGVKITFFIVGQDAALDQNKAVLPLIAERGHEVGNHSFHHESWLHQYSKDRIKKEILLAEDHIQRITGQKPVGFRGPGFSWSPELFSILAENGYLYDSSSLPTFIGPLARMYYFWNSNFTKEEKSKRDALYGSFKDGLRPVKPYLWDLNSNGYLLEIPISTMPVLKIPFHMSYLLYLSRFSIKFMKLYLQATIALCKGMKFSPSFLLHPLDFIGGDQVSNLAFFPGMDISSEHKAYVFQEVMKTIAGHFSLVNMNTHAVLIMKNRRKIKKKKLSSSSQGG